MREHHVGDLILVEAGSEGGRPIGIVTDRDLVIEVLASGTDSDSITLTDLPTRQLEVANENDDLMDTPECMRSLGVLKGILAFDDVLSVVLVLLNKLVALAEREFRTEVRVRSLALMEGAGRLLVEPCSVTEARSNIEALSVSGIREARSATAVGERSGMS